MYLANCVFKQYLIRMDHMQFTQHIQQMDISIKLLFEYMSFLVLCSFEHKWNSFEVVECEGTLSAVGKCNVYSVPLCRVPIGGSWCVWGRALSGLFVFWHNSLGETTFVRNEWGTRERCWLRLMIVTTVLCWDVWDIVSLKFVLFSCSPSTLTSLLMFCLKESHVIGLFLLLLAVSNSRTVLNRC